MTQLYALFDPTVQFQSRSGKNLVNGLIKVTYLDRTELAPVYDYDGKAIQNPITLDENGRAAVYVEMDKQYTIHVYDQNRQLVYTQNIREYPKDVTVSYPSIASTDSIEATLNDDTYTLDVKDDYIKKFAHDYTAGDGINIEQNTISLADDAKNTAEYFATGSGTTSVKGPFKSMRSDSATTGLTADLFDSEGTLIGHMIPKYGTPGQVLKSTYTNVYWADESSGTGNILVIDYGDTSKSLDDMKQYDTVLVNLNAKTFYLVDLDDSRAWFASSYVIESNPMLETVRYYADRTWDKISILDVRKVCVDKSSTPGFLEDVLVSDSDIVSLVKSDSKLHVQVNTEVSYDPKLQSVDEFAVNSSTSNYGAYVLNERI